MSVYMHYIYTQEWTLFWKFSNFPLFVESGKPISTDCMVLYEDGENIGYYY